MAWSTLLSVLCLVVAIAGPCRVLARTDVQPFSVQVCDTVCTRERRDAENEVGEQVRAMLEHYKQADPVGLPGSLIPDPVDVPDMKQSFAVTTMTFNNIKVHGLSKFRFQHVRADLEKLEMAVGVRIETMLIAGGYTLGNWFSRSSGPFTVVLTGVLVEGIAALEVNRAGKLTAEDINMDISFQNIKLNFENLGGMAYIFQGMVNTVGNFLFDSIKPSILKEVNTRLLAVINENIDKVPQRFPNSIPPLDMAVAVFRSDVRARGFDPFFMHNITHNWGGATIFISNIWVTGLASFYRVGEVSVAVLNNTANATVQVGTQKIQGNCHWEISVGWMSRTGTAKFWADYAQARVSVLQPLNVQRRPRIDRLALKLGNIQTRVHGAGTMDYVAELVLNVLPNLLRYQLVALAEEPLKQRVQDRLNTLDVEALILKQLEAMEGAAATPAQDVTENETENEEEDFDKPADDSDDFSS